MARKAFSAFMLQSPPINSPSHSLPPLQEVTGQSGPCLASSGFLTEHTGDNTCVDTGQKQLLRQGSPDNVPGEQSVRVK